MSDSVSNRPLHSPVTALMYHALTNAGTPSGQDPHYTLTTAAFTAQLHQIRRNAGGGSVRDWLAGTRACNVLLTFDDGHVSNYRHAFPSLIEHRMTADFFINPAIVGRPGFAKWHELREMSDQGMSVQSHGHDHVYLTSLPIATLHDTLRAARQQIEDRIGKPVTLLAPPGGRMPSGLPGIARKCGYSHVLSSRPGRIQRTHAGSIFPRMAVTESTTEAELESWISTDGGSLLRERARYAGLTLAKQMLGDARYERMRGRLLGASRGSV